MIAGAAPRLVVVLLVAAAAGCPAPDATSGLVTSSFDQRLDFNAFVCEVQPVLIRRCSFTACHGAADHALRVYSLGKLRLGDPATRKARSNTLLTSDEVQRNFESAAGMMTRTVARAPSDPLASDVPLLHRPLAAAFGGAEHQGVAMFPAWPATTLEADDEWQALVRWSEARVGAPPSQPCLDFFDAQGLVPR